MSYPAKYEQSEEEPGEWFPTEFEWRNVGVTLTVAPIVGPDAKSISLNLVPEVVSFLGFIDYTQSKPGQTGAEGDPLGDLLKAPLEEGGIWRPVFSTQKITTTVTVRSGETMLLGEMPKAMEAGEEEVRAKQEGEPGRFRTLVFVRASVLPVN